MIYYIATEIAFKPYIFWQTTDLKAGALVIPETAKPDYIFGVCPWKIVDGQLVPRTEAEMTVFETQYNAEIPLRAYQNKADALQTEIFDYKGGTYPMFLTARLYYSVMQQTPGDYVVKTTTGTANILEASRVEFLTAYYTKLKELTQP